MKTNKANYGRLDVSDNIRNLKDYMISKSIHSLGPGNEKELLCRLGFGMIWEDQETLRERARNQGIRLNTLSVYFPQEPKFVKLRDVLHNIDIYFGNKDGLMYFRLGRNNNTFVNQAA